MQVYREVLIQLIDEISESGENCYYANCIFPDGRVITTSSSSKSIDGAMMKARLIVDRQYLK